MKKKKITLKIPVKLTDTQKFIIKGHLNFDFNLIINTFPNNIIIPSVEMTLKRCNNTIFNDYINEYEFGSLVELQDLNQFKQYFNRICYDKWISIDNPDTINEYLIYSTLKENVDKIANFVYEHKKYFE